MFKKVLIVLSVCFLLGMATKAEVEGVKKEAEKEVVKSETNPDMWTYETLIKPSEELALYKTSLNVQTPIEGIETGHVIAYGHYIKPPYKFEIREDTLLYLNGIRIYPCLVNSKVSNEENKRIDEKYQKAHSKAEPVLKKHEILFGQMISIYKKITPLEGRETAIDSILSLISKDTTIEVVDTNRWDPNGFTLDIEYYLPGYCEPPEPPCFLSIEFRIESSQELSPYFKRGIKERAKNEKTRVESALKASGVVICSSFNQSINIYCESDFWEISGILNSKEFSLNEKLKKLFSVAAVVNGKELIYNFDPSEWPANTNSKREE